MTRGADHLPSLMRWFRTVAATGGYCPTNVQICERFSLTQAGARHLLRRAEREGHISVTTHCKGKRAITIDGRTIASERGAA